MFGRIKLVANHLTLWNEPPKVHVSISSWKLPCYNSFSPWTNCHKAFNSTFILVKNEFSKIKRKLTPKMPMAFDLQKILTPKCLHICKLVDLCNKIQHKNQSNLTPYVKDMNFQKIWKWTLIFYPVSTIKLFKICLIIRFKVYGA